MTFSFDEQEKPNKLFANEFLTEFPEKVDTSHLILSLRLNKKKNGYIIETESFLGFLWKNNTATKLFIEYVERENKETETFPLYAKLKKTKTAFEVIQGNIKNYRIQFHHEENTYYFLERLSSSQSIPDSTPVLSPQSLSIGKETKPSRTRRSETSVKSSMAEHTQSVNPDEVF